MWIHINKKILRRSSQIVTQFSNFINNFGENTLKAKKILINGPDKENFKSLKIAIVGLPNAGKSTLINFLIEKPICAISSKIHTTRKKAVAIFCINETQLIFLDTPGLVSKEECKKFKLENSFINDVQNSIKEADIIGIVQDVSKVQGRELISNKIIKLFEFSKVDTKIILILNKIDTLKNKKMLLEITNKLLKTNWLYFSDVFMISALKGDGVDDLRNYFLDSAKLKPWNYNKYTFTDQSFQIIIQQTVKANLLNNLPQEIPYLLNTFAEHIEKNNDGSLNIVVNVSCPSTRISRIVIGKQGERIKLIAQQAEQTMCKIFQTSVRLKIIVHFKEKIKVEKYSLKISTV